jgi:hypothetical protein
MTCDGQRACTRGKDDPHAETRVQEVAAPNQCLSDKAVCSEGLREGGTLVKHASRQSRLASRLPSSRPPVLQRSPVAPCRLHAVYRGPIMRGLIAEDIPAPSGAASTLSSRRTLGVCGRGVMMSSGSPAREKRTPRPPICSLNKCVKAKPNGHRAGSFAYAHRHYTILPVSDIGGLAASSSAGPSPYIRPLEYRFPGIRCNC